jgi:ribosomal protein S18 acetylase RimI-like enzyme
VTQEAATGQSLSIRSRQEADIPDAARALVKVHASDGYPVEGVDEPEAWLTPPEVLQAWIANLDGAVVGHVALSHPNGEDAVSLWLDQSGASESEVAVLARLFVTPEARRMALGRRLTETAMEYADAHGLRLVLDVMTKDTAAIRLYEDLGWQQIGTSTHPYGDGQQTDAICYVSPATTAAR